MPQRYIGFIVIRFPMVRHLSFLPSTLL